jgi:hypothetical membrane protein
MHDRERLGAIVWILTLQFFVVQVIVQAAWTEPFSLAHNMISDLGRATCGPLYRSPVNRVACSPLYQVMNASIMLNGILILIGWRLTRSNWPATRLTSAGLAMIALSAPGHVLTGLFPSDIALAPHMAGAGSILALANPGMVLVGIATWRERRVQSVVSLLCGLAGITGTIFFLWSIEPAIGLGGWERVAFYPLPVWCAVHGLMSLKRRTTATA